MGRDSSYLKYKIVTTEASGVDRTDFWQDQWGKPTAKKMRELVAKRPGAKPLRARVIEASPHLAEPATLVDITP